MYQNKKILGIIPARGGSKGIPRKNIRDLAGKPLIAWTIEAAKGSKYIDTCMISTEDEEIQRISQHWGGYCPFLRPTELAQDDTSSADVVLYVLEEMPGFDYVVLLQPTSPLRVASDIDNCIKTCFQQRGKNCVSVVETENSPYYMYKIHEKDNKLQSVLSLDYSSWYQRQQLPIIYRLNGAVFVAEIKNFYQTHRFVDEDTLGYVMPRERSVDIDSLLDFSMAEIMLTHNVKEKEKEIS